MIIDKISLGGDEAYFNFLVTGGPATTDPAGITTQDVYARIPATVLGKGKQYAVNGISIQLEAADLLPLFKKQDKPIFRINVYKEMFTCLFANPYEHRVHNISGYEDFNRGKYTNCKAIDVEGIPTIVSAGSEEKCEWVSPIYPMPDTVNVDKIAWDLAASRLMPVENFSYSLKLEYWTAPPFTHAPHVVSIVHGHSTLFSPQDHRVSEPVSIPPHHLPIAYRFAFAATVKHDSSVYESHTIDLLNTMGTPLLRAIYLLEKVAPPLYEFYSLKELLDHCIDYHLFETPGPEVTKLTATIGIDALLVQSDNEGTSPGEYESVEFVVYGANNTFTYIEAQANITESITPPKAIQ